MKITKTQLKQIIKEEMQGFKEGDISSWESEGPAGDDNSLPAEDVEDALQMLRSEVEQISRKVSRPTLFHVINRLEVALDKLQTGFRAGGYKT